MHWFKSYAKKYPKCSKCNTLSGHFHLIMNFKVTIKKYLLLYILKGSFNINLKHSKFS